jgi:molybdenum cofactor guanylyltransferase
VTRAVIGIFVGGAGKRMGGVAKGLLEAPSGEPLIERLLGVCARGAPQASVYLVGRASAYGALRLPELADDPENVGPIGGLRSLLSTASELGAERALALACDLPFIDEAMLRLLNAPLTSAARVPFAGERFQPLAAAYAPTPALLAVDRALSRGKHALMQVLEELEGELERVAVDATRALVLRDWDTPGDITRE